MRKPRSVVLTLSLLALLLLLGAPRGAVAGDAPDRPAASGARIQALAQGLEALRIRLEAQLEKARLLDQMGRKDEAIAAYEEVERLHASGMADLHRLVGRAAAAVPSTDAPAAAPVRIPVEPGGAGGAFRGRGGSRDLQGGDAAAGKESEQAVDLALRWLAAHQAPSGAWEAEGFGRWCDEKPVPQGPDGAGKALYDPGVTGLALCAFLGAGYTNRGAHPYAKVVAKGLRYLKNIQDTEGCFGPRTSQHFIYNHATASLAMVEAYGMTLSPIMKDSAQRALDFIAAARNPYFAWRYGVKPGDNDTSVTGWMLMVLKSAQLINQDAVEHGRPAPLVVDEAAFDGVRAWLDKMTDPEHGRVGYIQRGGSPARPQALIDAFPADRSESMTAVGVLARILLGEDPRRSETIQKGVALMEQKPPRWNPTDGSIDMYYWYYGTLAMFQAGGSSWKTWSRALKSEIAANQRRDTDACGFKGSWDPVGPWGPDGGRVYATALMAMCLEVFYRYHRVFGAK